MVVNFEAVPFEIIGGTEERPVSCKAVLTVSKGSNWKKIGWRAVISLGGPDRRWGPVRTTVMEAVTAILDTINHKITACERERLVKNVLAMQTRRAATLSRPSDGSQPSSSNQVDAVAPSQVHPVLQDRGGVRFIHQIYGVLRDDKAMSPLYESSQRQWQEVAKLMSAHYHLWTADELESLVKQKYHQYWKMYCEVRYPIMRVDMGRILVVHAFGGLCADLDVMPNCTWFEQVEFGLPRVKDPKEGKRIRWILAPDDPVPTVKDARRYMDMKVVVGTSGNDVFMRWMDHIDTEIATKPYDAAESFWHTNRMRYVYETTGPLSMRRFLHHKDNVQVMRTMQVLECNHFKDAEVSRMLNLTVAQKRGFDVLSCESNSYSTKEHEIIVPVGPGDYRIPWFSSGFKRMWRKTPSKDAQHRHWWRVEPADTDIDVEPEAAVAHSQEAPLAWDTYDQKPYFQISEGAQAHSQDDSTLPSQSPASNKSTCLGCWDSYKRIERQNEQLDAYKSREAQLKKFFFDHRASVSTGIVFEQMPNELADWLMG